MSWKSRTVLATGAGVALVTAGGLAVANAAPEPTPVPLSEPSMQVDDLRVALDGLLAEVDGLESAVAAGQAVVAPTVAATTPAATTPDVTLAAATSAPPAPAAAARGASAGDYRADGGDDHSEARGDQDHDEPGDDD